MLSLLGVLGSYLAACRAMPERDHVDELHQKIHFEALALGLVVALLRCSPSTCSRRPALLRSS